MIRTFLSFLALFALAGCGAPSQPSTGEGEAQPAATAAPASAVDPSGARKAADALEGWDAIIEVMHDESLAVQWTIGVSNDGTKRFGLAESVCGELIDRGLVHDTTWVRVVDRQAVMSNGGDFRAASLGGVKCSTGDWIDP